MSCTNCNENTPQPSRPAHQQTVSWLGSCDPKKIRIEQRKNPFFDFFSCLCQGGVEPPTQYECTRSKEYRAQCATGCVGSIVNYTRTAVSTISVEDACQQAELLVDNAIAGQAYANNAGTCDCPTPTPSPIPSSTLTPTPTPSPTPSPSPIPSLLPSPSPSPSPSPTPTPTPSPSPSNTPSPTPTPSPSPTPTPSVVIGDCSETLSSGIKSAFDNWVDVNLSTYAGSFIGVLVRNNEIWYKESGPRNRYTRVSVASVGKHFAATVLLRLVDEGTLSLSTTAGSLIDSLQDAGKGAFTLAQLMSHTSGMQATSVVDGGSGVPYEDQSGLTMEEAVNAIAANVPLLHTPGTVYSYGGVHWCIAARMAEVAAGDTWENICQSRICGPLGMTNTSYNVGPPFLPTLNPMIHAGLLTTMDDWAKFLKMRIQRGVYNGVRILSESSILAMEVDQTGIGAGYGFGLYPGNPESSHYGATGCATWYNPGKKFAGAIFTNVPNGGTNGANDDFRSLARNILPQTINCPSPTPTPTPSPTVDYNCGDTIRVQADVTGFYIYPNKTIYVGDSPINVTFNWFVFDNPNRFTIYKNGVQLETTGWKGVASVAGPWGGSLNTDNNGSITLYGVSGILTLRAETGLGNGTALNDGWEVIVNCQTPTPTPTPSASGGGGNQNCVRQRLATEYIWLDEIKDGNTLYTGSGGTAQLINCEKKSAIDNWLEDGGGGIQITAKINEYEQSAGVLNSNKRNQLFAIYNYLREKNMKMLLKLHMNIGQATNNYPHIYNVDNEGVRTASGVFSHPWEVPLTLSSPSMSNFDRFWNLMGDTYIAYNYMTTVAVTRTPTQECEYPHEFVGDFHPTEQAAWANYQMSRFGVNLGGIPGNYNDLIGQRWLKFKGHQIRTFAKRWGAIFKSKGFSTILDNGSTVDADGNRGIWATITTDLKPEIDGLKENPAYQRSYPIEMITSIQTTYNASTNMVEFTRDPSKNVDTNANRIYAEMVRSRRGGSRASNFSFMSNYHDKNSDDYKVGHKVMKMLRDNDWLGKCQVCAVNPCESLTFDTLQARNLGGYENAYNSTYNQALNNCSDGDGYPAPKVTINDNL